ncbi:MAG TPA: matrixin family metalloprotease [Nitrososphaerales archaeon]|nr:matrixin family metalloprotease [Nitrososphaerales archaeon]
MDQIVRKNIAVVLLAFAFFFFAFVSPTDAFQYSSTSNGFPWTGPCHWGPTVYYYNGASINDAPLVGASAGQWSTIDANLQLIATTNVANAQIVLYSDTSGIDGVLAETTYNAVTCSNGSFSGHFTIYLHDNYLNGDPDGEIASVITHEMGHALGLAHVSDSWTVMNSSIQNWNLHHVVGPMRDDINAMVSMYGYFTRYPLQYNTVQPFSYSGTVNQPAGVSGDINEVRVNNPGPSTWAFAYATAAAPITPLNTVILRYEINSANLYRGAIGFWGSTNPTDITQRIAIAEFDDNGLKLGYSDPSHGTFSWVTIGSGYTSETHSMQIVLQLETGGLHAYFYDYNYNTDSWIGETDFYVYLTWGSSMYVGLAAWTDTTSNPPSDYWMDQPNSVGSVGRATSPSGNCLAPLFGQYGTYGPSWGITTSGCGGHYGYTFYAYPPSSDSDMMAVPANGRITTTGYFLKQDSLGSLACTGSGDSRSYLDLYILAYGSTGPPLASYMAINCTQSNGVWYYISYTFTGLTPGQYVKIAYGRTNSWSTDYNLAAWGSQFNVMPG